MASGRRRLPITREIRGESFVYRRDGRKIRSRAEIERIEAIAIPPAWTDVEIARAPSAKVLARGRDAAGRIQAIYHPAFRRRQERRKYARLERFGRALPRLRSHVDRDLRRRRLSRERVTASVVRLIDLELFRVGNPEYARRHRSYGVTTLREEHLTATSGRVEFDFTGKSGKRQRRSVRDPRLARLIGRLLDLPGPEVFRFLDDESDDGGYRPVRSRQVNDYLKRRMGEEFTAKDFRTWGATVLVSSALLAEDPEHFDTGAVRAAAVRTAIAVAAERLGNTPAVTRSAYVDPRILAAAEHPELLQRVRRTRIRPHPRLTEEESRTLALLRLARRASH